MIGKTGSDPFMEFFKLRAKMYNRKKYAKKHIQHQSFVKILKNASQTTTAKFRVF